jgi:hypothetical protein
MDKNLVQTLGKVMIAVAWGDKEMAPEEVNSLKDLLFQFQHTLTLSDVSAGDQLWAFLNGIEISSNVDAGMGIPAREMAKFEMYTETHIDAAERTWLLHQVCEAIQSEEDKVLIISSLKDMVEADGVLTEEEQTVLNEIKTMIENVDTGIFDTLKRFFAGGSPTTYTANERCTQSRKVL